MRDGIAFAAVVFLTYLAGFFHGRISLRSRVIRDLEKDIAERRERVQ